MISGLFNTVLYEPLYNALVYLTSIVPNGDFGLAIALLTLGVKIVLTPLQHRSLKMQRKMRVLAPEMQKLKEKYKKEPQVHAEKVFALYKEHGISPFASLSSILLIFIPLPIFFALYRVVLDGLPFQEDILYKAVSIPPEVQTSIFGIVDLTERSIPVALLVGVLMYLQVKLAMPALPKKKKAPSSIGEGVAQSMQTNMLYVMPVIIAVVSASIPAALSIYFLTSSIFAIGHELLVKRRSEDLGGKAESNKEEKKEVTA